MKLVEKTSLINTEDLKDISDKINQEVYIHTDPDTGDKNVHIRIFNDDGFDIGIQLGCVFSRKILLFLGEIEVETEFNSDQNNTNLWKMF